MEPKRPISDLDWAATPQPVKQYIVYLEQTISTVVDKTQQLEKRIEQLEVRTKKNSQNSSKPPSSDSPFKKPKKKAPSESDESSDSESEEFISETESEEEDK